MHKSLGTPPTLVPGNREQGNFFYLGVQWHFEAQQCLILGISFLCACTQKFLPSIKVVGLKYVTGLQLLLSCFRPTQLSPPESILSGPPQICPSFQMPFTDAKDLMDTPLSETSTRVYRNLQLAIL